MVLRGFGRAFKSNLGEAGDFLQSQEASHVDDFISHAWDSGRWLKVATLLIMYNSRSAVVASVVVAATISILQTDCVGLMPKWSLVHRVIASKALVARVGCWCLKLTPIFFFVVLSFWQRLRHAFGLKQRVIFVDKLCVNQVDEKRKAEGVLGIAGFLRHSGRLVVCWTPRYFSRLWCMYEIASWLHLRKPCDSVTLMPAAQTALILLIWVFSFSANFAFIFFPSSEGFVGICVWTVFSAYFILISLLFDHQSVQLTRSLEALPDQLTDFSVEKASCFCCTNSHVSPQTQEPLQCDRELIFQTMTDWFGPACALQNPQQDPQNLQQQALHTFDQFARTEFREWVLLHAGPTKISYSHCVFCCCPFLWRSFDVLSAACSVPSGWLLRFWLLEYVITALFVMPCAIKLWFCTVVQIDRATGISLRPILDYMFIPIRITCGYIICLTLYTPTYVLNRLDSFVPVTAYDVLVMCLTAALFGWYDFSSIARLIWGALPRRCTNAS